MKREEKQRQKRENSRRTWSVPSLNMADDNMKPFEYKVNTIIRGAVIIKTIFVNSKT